MDQDRDQIVEQTVDDGTHREFIEKTATIVGAALVGGMAAAALAGSAPAEGAVGQLPTGALKIDQLSDGARLSISSQHLAALFGNEALNRGSLAGKRMSLQISTGWIG